MIAQHAVTKQVYRKRRSLGVLVVALVATLLIGAAGVTAGSPTADEHTVDVTYEPESPTTDDIISFEATTTGFDDEVDISWYYGESMIGEGPSTTYQFPEPGTYTVTVVVQESGPVPTSHGEGPVTEQVTVEVEEPDPEVEIVYSPESPSVGESVTVEAQTTNVNGEVADYEWSVNGQEIPPSGDSFTTSFEVPGTHTLTVDVYEGEGAEPVATDQVDIEVQEVEEQPEIGIEYTPEAPTVDDTVTFEALLSEIDVEVYEIQWGIDGEYEASGNPFEHSFDAPGEYLVQVIAVPDEMPSSEAEGVPLDGHPPFPYGETTVEVTDENEPPTAGIDVSPENPVAGDKVSLSADASDPDGTIESYEWTIDGAATMERQSIRFQFANQGEYPVKLTVTDDDGDEATASTTVSVDRANAGPTVSIAPETETPTQGQATTIESTATDPDGEIANYEWTVGGTVVSDAETLTHTFDVAGEHEVSVTVTDDVGATASASTTVTVNAPPEASIDYGPSDPMVEESVSFTASASDPDGHVVEYEWTVDGESVGSGDALDHAFASAGEHEVTLSVTDDDGATATASASPVVAAPENEPPTVGAGDPPADVGVGDPVEMSADASDSDGKVSEYRWLIDGELVGSDESLQHAFESAGTYEVTLEVTDDAGETASESWTVAVSEPEEEPEVAGGGLGTTTILLVVLAAVALLVGAGYAYRHA